MRAITLVLVLVACNTKPQTALDYVELCAPGQAFVACERALADLRTSRKAPIPINDLVAIKVEAPRLWVPGRRPYTRPRRGAFKHMIMFRDGYGTVRARVQALIAPQLGESTRIKGTPPIDDPDCPGGDYWVASEGLWILNDTTVTWYSTPFEDLPAKHNFPRDPDGNEYRRPAASSAALWRKIGHVLVTY